MRKVKELVSTLLALAFLLLSTLSLSDPVLFLRDRVLFENNTIFAADFIDGNKTRCGIPSVLFKSVIAMVPGDLNQMILDSRIVANRMEQILKGEYKVIAQSEKIMLIRSGTENNVNTRFFSKKIECSNIKKTLEEFVRKKFGEDVNVSFLNLEDIPVEGTCDLSIPCIYPRKRISFLVKFESNGGLRIKSGILLLKRMRKVVVARRKIKYGELISKDDIELKKMDVFGMEDVVFSDIEDVVGKKTKKFFNIGEPLKTSDLIDPPYVVRGQIILAYVLLGDLKISTFVRAMKDGKIGETIVCRNINSGKLIYGVVEEGPKIRVLMEGI